MTVFTGAKHRFQIAQSSFGLEVLDQSVSRASGSAEVIAAVPRRSWNLNFSFHSVCFWLFIAELAWLPFWYASAGLGPWGANAVLFAGLLAIFESALLVTNQPHPVAVRRLWVPIALFAAVIFWIIAQKADWTPNAWHHPIWQMTADVLGRPVESSISVNRNATSLALLRLLTAASVFWLSLQLCRHTGRANHLMAALVAIICGYAVYGLIELSLRHTEIFAGRSYATSTFVNHNHFGAYVGVGLVITFGLLLQLYQRHADEFISVRQSIGAFFETSAQQAVVLLTAAFVLAVALMFSGSRGAVVSTSCATVALAILSFGRQGRANQKFLLLVTTAAIAGVALFFGDDLFGQVSDGGVSDQNRLQVYIITLRSIWDAPLWGYGYGTFADVFSMFRDRSLSVFGTWEQAHDSYLEIYQGLGLIFGSCLILTLTLLAARCFRGATQRQDNMVPTIATSVVLLLALHSLVDFSLQIQAITLTFMAVLGAGVAQSWSSRLPLYGA